MPLVKTKSTDFYHSYLWLEDDVKWLAKLGCMAPPSEQLKHVISAIKEVKIRSGQPDVFIYQNGFGHFLVTSQKIERANDNTSKSPIPDPGNSKIIPSNPSNKDTGVPRQGSGGERVSGDVGDEIRRHGVSKRRRGRNRKESKTDRRLAPCST